MTAGKEDGEGCLTATAPPAEPVPAPAEPSPVLGKPAPDFSEWFRTLRPKVIGSLGVMSGDSDAAAEAADEAFSRALARWDKVSGMASPDGWLFQVALNQLRRTKRRQGVERVLRFKTLRPDVEHELPHPELWTAVRALPDRQRRAVVLRYVADLPEADIAVALGVSRGTISSNLADARRRLELTLADREDRSEVTS
jgi:RNA polymerase sigma-70 factor (ECF subfamily)